MIHRIANFDSLARSAARADALAIAEAAYDAIDTERAVRARLTRNEDTLIIDGAAYDLSAYKRVRVVGFGKASCKAIQTIESVVQGRITDGLVIDVRGSVCDVAQVVEGTHPRPSPQNVVATERIVELAKDSREDDLVLMAVSGGGSSLLCWPIDECEQSAKLFDDAQRVGMPIHEMNTVRKHISSVKGGALAALFHPAHVVAFIFCDVPGDHFEDVASGPTYYDHTTVADANKILEKYQLSGYTLNETPKDSVLFEHVRNVPVISNTIALAAMRTKAQSLGYQVIDIGPAHYEEPAALVAALLNPLQDNTAVLGGGEMCLQVTRPGGTGGRCQYLALSALSMLGERDVLLPFASDGIDNSEAAGALVDASTKTSAATAQLSAAEALAHFDTYPFLKTTDDLLITGPTDANVSDLYIAIRK